MRYRTAAGSVSELKDGDDEESTDLCPTAPGGEPLAGWVQVRGIKAHYPPHHEITRFLTEQGVLNADGQPMTAGAVERRLRPPMSASRSRGGPP